ncbi:hypothetical protein [Halalkalibacter urbisdiaboli]|uniref:hypothetical protein n=1 Tax=Halalkalibacter urbisdiaboli TaxID=1960589 RepID=UPI000B44D49F|nr:hypothetical protein [Halalkalibacter urbisdiaboli]
MRVGLKTEEVKVTVTEGMIQTYLSTLGFESVGTPITFVMMFWKSIQIPWSIDGLIHGEQSIQLQEPIKEYTTYHCSVEITQILRKRHLTFYVHTLHIKKNGIKVGQAISTLVKNRSIGAEIQ